MTQPKPQFSRSTLVTRRSTDPWPIFTALRERDPVHSGSFVSGHVLAIDGGGMLARM